MQAYDVKRKRIVNIQRMENGTIIAYSLPDDDSGWYFPLIVDNKNAEPYEFIDEQISMF